MKKEKNEYAPIDRQYEKAFEQAAALQPIFPEAAKRQMAQMVEAIARGNKHIDWESSTGRTIAQKAGFIAEEVHAETFNLDAILNGEEARAYTDRYGEWNNQVWKGRHLHEGDVTDIIIVEDGKIVHTVQSKYCATPEGTAKALSTVENGQVKYRDNDAYLAPEDQINRQYRKVPGESKPEATTTVREHAEAQAAAMKETKPVDSEAYEQTARKSTDRVKHGDSSSKPLSKKEAEDIAAGDRSKLKQLESEYETKSTVKQMGQAALGAAAMSAVISGSINTVKYIQLAKEGKITAQEATIKIVGETVSSAVDSAVKASANAGIQSLIIRYSSEKVAMDVLVNHGLKQMVKTNVVTVSVVCAVDLVKDLVSLGMGRITEEQFYERQGKGALSTASGIFGSALGTASGAGLATAFGASAGTMAMTVASVVGGLSGGIIAGLAMSFAIESGIEKPYRELVENTKNLHEASQVLERVSQKMAIGQRLSTETLEAGICLDKKIERQMQANSEAGNKARDAINMV